MKNPANSSKAQVTLTTAHRHIVGTPGPQPRESADGRFTPRRRRRHNEQAIVAYLRTLKS
jgi:hypothetical protein